MRSPHLHAISIIVASILLAACAPAAPPPIADPRRPPPQKIAREETKAGPVDCAPAKPTEGPPAKAYKERSTDEGATYAEVGLKLLIEAEEPSMPVPEKQKRIEGAIQKFFTALSADPYNVLATYNLAAAYARIGRNQCALNLLARLAEMASWPSQKEALEDAANRLFGRGKKWKDKPDPDFDRLRQSDKFREIANQIKGV